MRSFPVLGVMGLLWTGAAAIAAPQAVLERCAQEARDVGINDEAEFNEYVAECLEIVQQQRVLEPLVDSEAAGEDVPTPSLPR